MIKESLVNRFAAGAINLAAKHFKLDGLGHVEKATIDPGAKTVNLKAKLKGEEDTVEIIVGGYSIERGDEGSVLNIKSITISRPWMQRAADLWMPRSFNLTPEIAGILRAIL